jgi:hypothetical protein
LRPDPPVSVDAFQARLIWLQPTADAMSPVGTEGAMRSGSVVDVVLLDVLVVVVVAPALTTNVVALATFE